MFPEWRTSPWRSRSIPRCSPIRGDSAFLAGDTLRSAADPGVLMVAASLLHRKGYFRLNEQDGQHENIAEWSPEQFLELMKPLLRSTSPAG